MNSKGHETVIFTVGYEGTEIEEFACKLTQNAIAALIDVRKNAISRKRGFSKTKLSDKMRTIGIEYYHMPELGIPSSLRKQLDASRPETYSSLFDYYEQSILHQASDSITRITEIAKEKGSIAITCFESDHRYCHRNRIANKIILDKKNSYIVQHI
jgi:uncharacterized protein (DUF488 family)